MIKLSKKLIAEIESKFSPDLLNLLKSNNISVLDIHTQVSKTIQNYKLSSDEVDIKVKELSNLINSLPTRENLLRKKECKYFQNLKEHKTEFLRLMAEGILREDFTIAELTQEFHNIWNIKGYSCMNILENLGYPVQKVLLKYIGIQNSGMMPISREQKLIVILREWLESGKIQKLVDVEDCFFWCQSKFEHAAISYSTVVKWMPSFQKETQRDEYGRLVFKTTVDSNLEFLNE